MQPVALLLLALPFCSAVLNIIGRQQSVAVTGRLTCNGSPSAGTRVKLYDDDLTLDAKLGETTTDSNGQFTISGSIRDITSADPKVNIYHKCNYNGLCYKKVSILIPQSYITYGSQAQSTYDIGTIVLSNQFSGETIDCLN
ncbi:hypothetical protein Q1695_011875 [Nippostrongylus brasiliensis]|nr:hypothetical protein Q1695_011875 [Nippostrongylus brasiliensis]